MSEGTVMGAPLVDLDLVRRICGSSSDDDVVFDALDGSVWVHMPTPVRASLALSSLNACGIGGHDLEDGRLHVTGWDGRLLHWRLGALLAGVDDLSSQWVGTEELVYYHHDRRVIAGVEPTPADVLADVEDVLRSCVPIPHQAPRTDDIDVLLELVSAAADAYDQLIAEHIEYGEQVLTAYIARLHPGAA